MSTILVIFLSILGLSLLLWFFAVILTGLAYLKAKHRERKSSVLHEDKVIEQPEIKEFHNELSVESSLMIEPKDKVDVESKLKVINNLLKKYKEESNNIALLVFGSMIGIGPSEIIGSDADLISKYDEYTRKIIEKENFVNITKGRINIGQYDDSLVEGVNVYYNLFLDEYFDRFEYFLINFKGYFDLIENKTGIIASKKRALVQEDEFGDADGNAWIDYLQRFAEKMDLINPHSAISSEFEAVEGYLSIINLDKFQGRALGYLFVLYEHFQKMDDPLANVITGVDFELHLKTIVESNLENAHVEITPTTGDHGADLIVRYRGITIAIQAKYYTGSVGNAAVQEIHSGMGYYDADFGMVVTQSKYTEHAKSLANKLNIYLEDVGTFVERIKLISN